MNFAGFDGKGMHDLRPKHRRQEVLSKGIPDGMEFDNSMLKNEKGEIDQALVMAESYAFSGFVIEQMWADVKIRPDILSGKDDSRIPFKKDFWQKFYDRYEAVDAQARMRFSVEISRILDKIEDAYSSNTPSDLNQDEKNIVRWHYINALLLDRQGSLPSMIGFIAGYAQLARVARDRFGEQFGREPERGEYAHMLLHPSFQGILTQMMTNSRGADVFLQAQFQGYKKIPRDLKRLSTNMSRRYAPDCFDIKTQADGPVLQPNAEVVEELRQLSSEWVAWFNKQSGQNPKVLRCPVIYTPIFKEMCDWMYHEFAHHYLDQKYGERTS